MVEKKLSVEEIEELSKNPNQGFDNCSVCGGVQVYGTMSAINELSEDLICEECLSKNPIDKNFNLSLEITISAKTPLEAAKKLQEMIQDKAEGWQYYVQEDGSKEIFSVDLDEEDADAVLPANDYYPIIKN